MAITIRPSGDGLFDPERLRLLPPGAIQFDLEDIATVWVYLVEEHLEALRTLTLEASIEIGTKIYELLQSEVRKHRSRECDFDLKSLWIGQGPRRWMRPGESDKLYGSLIGYSIRCESAHISQEDWVEYAPDLEMMAVKFGFLLEREFLQLGVTGDKFFLVLTTGSRLALPMHGASDLDQKLDYSIFLQKAASLQTPPKTHPTRREGDGIDIKIFLPPDNKGGVHYSKDGTRLWRIDRRNLSTIWIYVAEEWLAKLHTISESLDGERLRSLVEGLLEEYLRFKDPIDSQFDFCVRWVIVGEDLDRTDGDARGTRLRMDRLDWYEKTNDDKRYRKLVGYSLACKVDYLNDVEYQWCMRGIVRMAKKFGDTIFENSLRPLGIGESEVFVYIPSALFERNDKGGHRLLNKKC